MRNYRVCWAIDDIQSYDVIRALDPYSARLSFVKNNPGVTVTMVCAE